MPQCRPRTTPRSLSSHNSVEEERAAASASAAQTTLQYQNNSREQTPSSSSSSSSSSTHSPLFAACATTAAPVGTATWRQWAPPNSGTALDELDPMVDTRARSKRVPAQSWLSSLVAGGPAPSARMGPLGQRSRQRRVMFTCGCIMLAAVLAVVIWAGHGGSKNSSSGSGAAPAPVATPTAQQLAGKRAAAPPTDAHDDVQGGARLKPNARDHRDVLLPDGAQEALVLDHDEAEERIKELTEHLARAIAAERKIPVGHVTISGAAGK